uniref:Uncharacterized protein n=1 Tax=Glossina morsitans morsitans TaxID=37546 RepID=A0A1B0GE92_GLOMM
MKVEFGVDEEDDFRFKNSDAWRLCPAGDNRLMVDKQVYCNMASVTSADLDVVKSNFFSVCNQLQDIIPKNDHLIVILMSIAKKSPGNVKEFYNCLNYRLLNNVNHK